MKCGGGERCEGGDYKPAEGDRKHDDLKRSKYAHRSIGPLCAPNQRPNDAVDRNVGEIDEHAKFKKRLVVLLIAQAVDDYARDTPAN